MANGDFDPGTYTTIVNLTLTANSVKINCLIKGLSAVRLHFPLLSVRPFFMFVLRLLKT